MKPTKKILPAYFSSVLSRVFSNAFLTIFLCVLSITSSAQVLLKTQTSWDGGVVSYPQGQAEITSHKLTLKPEQDMKYHCHPVPTQAYILKGELLVETLSGKSIVLKAGESILEVMNTIHRGKAIGGEVELVVFYAGANKLPNTVLHDSPLSAQYCTE